MKVVDIPIFLNNVEENTTALMKPIIIKGAGKVNFTFPNFNEDVYRVNSVLVDWGDGSPREIKKRKLFNDYRVDSIFDEVLYGKIKETVLVGYTHEYYNTTSRYGITYYPQFLIEWENDVFVIIIQPITVTQASFYDDIEQFNVLDTQILPISSNTTFINFECNKTKTAVIGYADTSTIPPLSGDEIREFFSVYTLDFNDAGFLATSNYEDIEFPTTTGDMYLTILIGYSTDSLIGFLED